MLTKRWDAELSFYIPSIYWTPSSTWWTWIINNFSTYWGPIYSLAPLGKDLLCTDFGRICEIFCIKKTLCLFWNDSFRYSVLASLEPRSSTRNEHDSLTNITKKSNNFPYNFLSNNLVFSDELSSIKTFNRSSISFVKEVPMFHKHHLAKQCKVGLTYCTLTLDLWNNVFLQLLLFGSTVHVSVVTITVVVSFVSPAWKLEVHLILFIQYLCSTPKLYHILLVFPLLLLHGSNHAVR